MTGRERLMATLRGQSVDRPAVNLYEIGGFDVDPFDLDEFNVYNDPSWHALLDLAEERTDLIRMRSPRMTPLTDGAGEESSQAKSLAQGPREELFQAESYTRGSSRFTRTTLRVAGRTMTALSRRDPDLHTTWRLEHLLKGPEDLRAYLELPEEPLAAEPDVTNLLAAEQEVNGRGIVMVDTGDPLCTAADLFSMEDYTVVALTEQKLFHRLLEKISVPLYEKTQKVAEAFPGRLWRICGAEYATEPYLPPHLFREYVTRYTGPMVETIQKYGGFARIHSHGRIRSALPAILEMHPAAIDPIEPPPLGDVLLADVRRQYGRDLALFGNIEIRDIENTEPAEFERIVAKSLQDGTAGEGRGFVLMPTACPCGRTITPRTLTNYQTMVRLATEFGG